MSVKWNIKNGMKNFYLWPKYRMKINSLSYFLYFVFYFSSIAIYYVFIYYLFYKESEKNTWWWCKGKNIVKNFNNKGKPLGLLIFQNWPVNLLLL